MSSLLKLKNTSYFHLLKEEEDANERRAIRKMDELKQWGHRFPKLRVWLKTLKKASWWTHLDVFVTCDKSEKMGQQVIFYDPSISLLLKSVGKWAGHPTIGCPIKSFFFKYCPTNFCFFHVNLGSICANLRMHRKIRGSYPK